MIPAVKTVADVRAALAHGQSLGARWYTDPAIAQLEIERLFRKSWSYVG